MAVPKFQHREYSKIFTSTVDTLNDIVNEWFRPLPPYDPECICGTAITPSRMLNDMAFDLYGERPIVEPELTQGKREERTMKRRWPFVRRSTAEYKVKLTEKSRDAYREWYYETTRSKDALQKKLNEMKIECSNAKAPWHPYPPGTKAVFRRSVDAHDIIAGEEYPEAAVRVGWFSSSSSEPVLVLVDGYLRPFPSEDVRIVPPPEKPKRRRRRAK